MARDEVKDCDGLEHGEQYTPLKIVEPLKRRCTEEHQVVSFTNIWASDEGQPTKWIRDIHCAINYLKMKVISFDDIFSMLVKILKKAEYSVDLAEMNSN